MAGRLSIVVVLLAVLLGYVYNFHLRRIIHVSGAFRKPERTEVAPGDYVTIDNTLHCEDMHYHELSGLIFTACEDYKGSRLTWFPPLGHFGDPSTAKMKGRLQVIDPKTFKTQILALEGFSGPFVTHGIDVIDDPDKPKGEAVYIFAINHKPNSEYYRKNGDVNAAKAHSVVELFHHVVGSDKALHIRTIWHPLIVTPNDLFAESPTSFFVTNDHYYREGFLRIIEDVFPMAAWTNVIHVQLQPGLVDGSDNAGVHASIALDKLHNLNGLGHGRAKDEILANGCTSGLAHVGQIREDKTGRKIINVKEVVEFGSPIDNPTYFRDPYANGTFDASGIVSSGPTRGVDFFSNKGKEDVLDPIMVWKASPRSRKEKEEGFVNDEQGWEVDVIFQDDGHRIRTASASVLVAIDPEEEGGRRRAWLFISSYHASRVIAVKIDL
ncbi:serum paraoxonase arylesterase family [Trichoderma cornu-damae]|uniref:Serum paraoxonase arylesterase family n=1 Tax=Trichoderma cornu-damae TaxID=654480 RepID=A0A9P8QP64_9HYPO|nr:serum paraoxonase arylesterase family [Trichoderma cornu-damae]